jgi:uncharacterized damage-inducible protein DinB
MDFQRLFAYENWANREALASIMQADDPSPQVVRTMAHIIGVGWLWLARLQQQPSHMAVWPELEMAELEEQVTELARAWRSYLGQLTEERLSEKIAYVNSKGESWANTAQEMIMHQLLHSAYHRGQIAVLLRMSDNEPAYTDYIHAVRQHCFES